MPILKNKILYISISIGLCLGFLIGIYISLSEVLHSGQSIKVVFISGLIGAVTAIPILRITKFMDSFVPWQNSFGIRLFLGIILSFIILIIATGVPLIIWDLLGQKLIDIRPILGSSLNIKLAVLLLVISILGNIIYLAFYSYYSYTSKTIQLVRSKRQQIDLQINALKSQLSPHFLFNNLNTISSLIHQDVDRAEDFVREMASCYQYTLNSYNSTLVPLEDEINFVKSSMYLLQTRFKNAGNLTIDLKKKILKSKVPSLSIQMLVENALKHNVSSALDPVYVKIFSDGSSIFVDNNKTQTPHNVISTKVGLNNIKERYRLLSKQNIEITDKTTFSVKLPLLK